MESEIMTWTGEILNNALSISVKMYDSRYE